MNAMQFIRFTARVCLAATILGGGLFSSQRPVRAAAQVDIIGPSGSVRFGTSVTVLPNGNIVVTDPWFDGGIGVKAGAVYLYNGTSGERISMLTGMAANDQVGSGGVTVLSNGNYIVKSPKWNNSAGAVTWGNKTSGVSGAISSENSLIGSTAGDQVGSWTIILPQNSNYVVINRYWDKGAVVDAGAVTWGNGTTGTSGVVSASNSLVGSANNDTVGESVYVLEDGNYVVLSSLWDNGSTADVGAVTQANGSLGLAGAVSPTNSLLGSQAGDQVGYHGLTILENGNYVVSSPYWDNGDIVDAGAVTWVDSTIGITGVVSPTNSLVGSTANDQAGYWTTYSLNNGNYIAISSLWDNGDIVDAGAATWGNGSTGTTGPISSENSLVGSTSNDQVGATGIITLANGNFVLSSSDWDYGSIVDAGAVTWGDGSSGTFGEVSASNSLVGSSTNDQVGNWATIELSNGNYIVRSPNWDNGEVTDAGATTWGNGESGIAGTISVANSLIGTHLNDQVSTRIMALPNGNYLAISCYWDNGGSNDAGAVTWGDGSLGIKGVVSAANSLVGSTTEDYVGCDGPVILNNSDYAVRSPRWDNNGASDVGAITWGDGTAGITGPVSSANSLVGSSAGDNLSDWSLIALNNGNYVLPIPRFDSGGVVDIGAVAWIDGSNLPTGVFSSANSLVGSSPEDQVGYDVKSLGTNYVVRSYYWDNGLATDAGAVAWGDGATGISGVVSPANSLVGSAAQDRIGGIPGGDIFVLENGNYIVTSPHWDNGSIIDAGAVTWGMKNGNTIGPITLENSVLGTTQSGGTSIVFQFDPVNYQLVVGRPYDNIVTLFKQQGNSGFVYLPAVMK